jgi:hypothetical protein
MDTQMDRQTDGQTYRKIDGYMKRRRDVKTPYIHIDKQMVRETDKQRSI